MDRAQRLDEENGVICLLIMLTPTDMVFKMSEITNFLYFLLITAKHLSQLGQYIKVHMEDLIEFLQKMIWLISFGLNFL